MRLVITETITAVRKKQNYEQLSVKLANFSVMLSSNNNKVKVNHE